VQAGILHKKSGSKGDEKVGTKPAAHQEPNTRNERGGGEKAWWGHMRKVPRRLPFPTPYRSR
jgi:hypothetical protein